MYSLTLSSDLYTSVDYIKLRANVCLSTPGGAFAITHEFSKSNLRCDDLLKSVSLLQNALLKMNNHRCFFLEMRTCPSVNVTPVTAKLLKMPEQCCILTLEIRKL